MVRVLVLLAACLICGGCSVSGAPAVDDVAVRQVSAAQLAAEVEASAKAQEAQCLSYGAKPGSPGYVKCRKDLALQDEAKRVPAPTPVETARSRPARQAPDPSSSESIFNVCSYGGTITNCY
jgi:hypothetical protein